MKIAIVGLNSDKVFVLTPVKNNMTDWRQYKIGLKSFISIMWDNFEGLMIKSKPHHFTNEYQLCNWLFNYGFEKGETVVFDNGQLNYLYLDSIDYEENKTNFRVKRNTPIYSIWNNYLGDD